MSGSDVEFMCNFLEDSFWISRQRDRYRVCFTHFILLHLFLVYLLSDSSRMGHSDICYGVGQVVTLHSILLSTAMRPTHRT